MSKNQFITIMSRLKKLYDMANDYHNKLYEIGIGADNTPDDVIFTETIDIIEYLMGDEKHILSQYVFDHDWGVAYEIGVGYDDLYDMIQSEVKI